LTSYLSLPDPTAGDRWTAVVGASHLLYGAGRLSDLGGEARALGARRVLLVTDPGLREAGHVEAAERSLAAAGLSSATFWEIDSEPSTDHVEAGAGFARAAGPPPGVIVALGGGSAMDCAKGINFLLTNGGRMEDYWGFAKASHPLLPALAAPTTAGTGSDAQSYALISQAGSGRKMACGDPSARFRAVILDPELTATAPRDVAGRAGIDAISHAVESYVCLRRTPDSARWALDAFRRLEAAFEVSLEPGAPEPIRGQMLLGAHLAGVAIEASMLGAAHAAANPLTARHRIAHGEAVGLMLPAVVRFNAPVAETWYRELAAGGAESLARRVEALRDAAGLGNRLRALGVEKGSLDELAKLATAEWTGGFNPRPVSEEDFLGLYEAAL